jgi:hypothetical protein
MFDGIENITQEIFTGNVFVWVVSSVVFLIIFEWFYRITKIKKFQ